MKAYTKLLPEGFYDLGPLVDRADYKTKTARNKEDQNYYRKLYSLLKEAESLVNQGLPPVEWDEEGDA